MGGTGEMLLAEDTVFEGVSMGNVYLSSRIKYVMVSILAVGNELLECIGGVEIPAEE
jgi:hypothetical protein